MSSLHFLFFLDLFRIFFFCTMIFLDLHIPNLFSFMIYIFLKMDSIYLLPNFIFNYLFNNILPLLLSRFKIQMKGKSYRIFSYFLYFFSIGLSLFYFNMLFAFCIFFILLAFALQIKNI